MSKIAAGARRNTCSKITGFAVEFIVAAVFGIEPGDSGSGNLGGVGNNRGLPASNTICPDGAPPRLTQVIAVSLPCASQSIVETAKQAARPAMTAAGTR